MNNIKSIFTIKDLENISGIKAHTIRIWEKRYGLLAPKRTDTNIRYYSSESLQKLLNVVLLYSNNYKISKIAEMSNEQIKLTAKELSLKMTAHDEAINELKMAMFQFDKTKFNAVYHELIRTKTFREVFKEVFIPLLEHIGMLWQTDTLVPAHEHFISNLIIQKIQINTEKLEYLEATHENQIYVLFLPEGEIHEIGLLYLNYELILRGYHTIYLGQSLPLNNLMYFIDNEVSVCFVNSLTVMPYEEKVKEYFDEFNTSLKNTKHQFVSIGAKAMMINTEGMESNILVFPSMISFLETL